MRRWIVRSALLMAVMMASAACAADGSTPENADPVSSSTTGATSTSEASSSSSTTETTDTVEATDQTAASSTTEATDPPPQIDGPTAPDFTFALADGSSFSLSAEQKPVYMVFWAEW